NSTMSKNISVGIDIGSYQIKVVVAESLKESDRSVPKIIGVGYAESRGLRHGYILSQEEVIKSLRAAISQAEKAAGVKIKKAFISIGGVGLGSITSNGTVVISRADSEITDLDVKKAIDVSQSEIPTSFAINKKVIHTVPIQYKVDGKAVYGEPI